MENPTALLIPVIDTPTRMTLERWEDYYYHHLVILYNRIQRYLKENGVDEIFKNIDYPTFCHYMYVNSSKVRITRSF